MAYPLLHILGAQTGLGRHTLPAQTQGTVRLAPPRPATTPVTRRPTPALLAGSVPTRVGRAGAGKRPVRCGAAATAGVDCTPGLGLASQSLEDTVLS